MMERLRNGIARVDRRIMAARNGRQTWGWGLALWVVLAGVVVSAGAIAAVYL
jgi:hypothetical protein